MERANIRASSWWELFDCPLRWAMKNIEGLWLPATAPARIGTAVHRSTAVFDESRVDGTDYVSIDDAADVAVETIRKPDEEVDWQGMNENKAIEIAVGCHTKYCSEIGADMEYAAVEQTLDELTIDVPLDNERSVEITLTGTLDRVRREAEEYMQETEAGEVPVFREGYGICDVKTGARAVSSNPSRHKAQLGVYELLASQAGYEIDLPAQILALQTSSNYDAAVHEVAGAREMLLGTPEDPGLLTFAADMIEREQFFGNASSILCNEKYCPHFNNCKFR
jgi:hypothetical protein